MANLNDILRDYSLLPEYSGLTLIDVNQPSLFGDKPINISATRGIVPEIQAILDAGGDVNSRGEHGYTPLHNAVEQGHLEAIKVLLSRGADLTIESDQKLTSLDLAGLLDRNDIAEYLKTITSNKSP